MAYCTQSDIAQCLEASVLVYVTDDAGTGEVDSTKVLEAISKAGAEIDAYCQSRHPVPFSPVPDLIRSLAQDIAVYNLFSRRGFRESTADQVVKDRYENARTLLRDIAKGVASIATGTTDDPVSPAGMVVRARAKIFGEDTLARY